MSEACLAEVGKFKEIRVLILMERRRKHRPGTGKIKTKILSQNRPGKPKKLVPASHFK